MNANNRWEDFCLTAYGLRHMVERRYKSLPSFFKINYLPILLVIPLLTVSIPIPLSPTREIAAYYQSLSVITFGPLPGEHFPVRQSDASLNLYSIIAAPLVDVGYFEAGRLVSYTFSIITTISLVSIIKYISSYRAVYLSPLLLWVNPYFFVFSWTLFPEAVSLGATTSAVALILLYISEERMLWYIASLFMTVIGVANHGWELVIILPIVSVLLLRGKWKHALFYAAIPVLVGLFIKTVLLTDSTAADTSRFLITSTGPSIFTTIDYWNDLLGGLFSGNPFFITRSFHFILGIATVVYWALFSDKSQTISIFMISYAVSGLSIVVLLPGGVTHFYYLWAVIPPITLTIAVLFSRIISRLEGSIGSPQYVFNTVVAVLLLVAIVQVGVFVHMTDAAGTHTHNVGGVTPIPVDAEQKEILTTAKQIREAGVQDPQDIAFVGNWAVGNNLPRSGIVQIFIYSGINLNGDWYIYEYVHHVNDVQDLDMDRCEVFIKRENSNDLTVHKCSVP